MVALTKQQLLERFNLSKEYAESKGGEFRNTEADFGIKNILFHCNKHNHSWKTSWGFIKDNSWCFYCGRESANTLNKRDGKSSLEKAREKAASKNGECLSTEYTGYGQKMLWKCSNSEHKPFYSTYINVVSCGRWCLNCGLERKAKNNTTENRVRMILEMYFGFSLKTQRPDWNRYPWNGYVYPLELDGYNKQFKIAFEYDGYQHDTTKNVHFFSGKKPAKKFYALQKMRDYAKEQNCIREGVTLIRINNLNAKITKKFESLLEAVRVKCLAYDIVLDFTDEQIEELRIKFLEEGSNG